MKTINLSEKIIFSSEKPIKRHFLNNKGRRRPGCIGDTGKTEGKCAYMIPFGLGACYER